MAPHKVLVSYRHGRAVLSSVIGFGFLVAGLFQTSRGGARGSDLVWFILVFFICQFFAYRTYRNARNAADELRFDELVAKREARLAQQVSKTGAVVGTACEHCTRRIVVAHDGCRCPDCSAPLHDDCKTEHVRGAHSRRVGASR